MTPVAATAPLEMPPGNPSAPSTRFTRIKARLLSGPVHLCPERAYLITDYFRNHDDPSEPLVVRKARAFRHLMTHKTAMIFPDELIVGNVGGRREDQRKCAVMHPELASCFLSQDLLWIDRRKTTPFRISWSDRLRILGRVLPYWLPRNMVVKAPWPGLRTFLRYTREQLGPVYYLVNEAAGIGHFLPNYERMIRLGVEGYRELATGKDQPWYRAALIALDGLVIFAERMAARAEALAAVQPDPIRAAELREIGRICRRVPRKPAATFHEAVQSLWLTHLGVCMEGFDSAVSLGRLDQYLYPYYQQDIEFGTLTPERAKDILLCFSAKTAEHVHLISERASRYHGGFLTAQAAIVGGTDSTGRDATNPLSYLLLEVMAEANLREPNYQARLHPGTPREFTRRAVDVCRRGGGVPALFNDRAAVAALKAAGYPEEEARNYAVVGCVELALPGRSFLSTDAALVNLPVCLELALFQGKRMSGRRRIGRRTPDPTTFRSIEDVLAAFRDQVEFMVDRLLGDLRLMEQANRLNHPTPLSSALVDGCLESGLDVTAGGALYNSSGVQGVGLADVADSLSALDDLVFRRGRYPLARILTALRADFRGHEKLRAELLKAPKFGNDLAEPDRLAQKVATIFHQALGRHVNTRGGPYVPGFYSSTTHVAFGAGTPALPSGRRAGLPFASSLGPTNGSDRQGPTAILNSVASIDPRLAPNGYALNLMLDPGTASGDRGIEVLSALVGGYFANGGLEVQFNVIAPEVLEDARRHPGKYPGLVVRVAGYLANFDDLPDPVKGEIISRTRLTL